MFAASDVERNEAEAAYSQSRAAVLESEPYSTNQSLTPDECPAIYQRVAGGDTPALGMLREITKFSQF